MYAQAQTLYKIIGAGAGATATTGATGAGAGAIDRAI